MDEEKQDGFFVMKVTLTDQSGRVRGRPTRTFSIFSERSLYQLAYVITEIFDFDFDHAFGFYNNFKRWSRSTEGYELFADEAEESQFPGVKKIKIKDVFTERKKRMLFVYDYGDFWLFRVELEGWMEITGKFNKNEYLPMIFEGKSPSQY